MLPKSLRLTGDEVLTVLKNGKSLRAPTASVKYIPAPRGKVAVVVSLKVAKLAAKRNALRRAGYRALPRTLPPRHMVFFIQQQPFAPQDIAALCSQLS
jgi:RNase P protein component